LFEALSHFSEVVFEQEVESLSIHGGVLSPPHMLRCAGKSSESRAILWLICAPPDHLRIGQKSPSGAKFLQRPEYSKWVGADGLGDG
jgi:hypothetical protein